MTHDFDYEFWTTELRQNYARAVGAKAAGAQPVETIVKVHDEFSVSLPCVDIELAYDGMLVELHSLPNKVKSSL